MFQHVYNKNLEASICYDCPVKCFIEVRGLGQLCQSVERKDGGMQRALEALLSDWMGVLSGLRRLWEAAEVTSLITSPGEENPPHTPLAALIDAGDLRGLVAQLTQSWQAAFARVEDFRQVRKGADAQLW